MSEQQPYVEVTAAEESICVDKNERNRPEHFTEKCSGRLLCSPLNPYARQPALRRKNLLLPAFGVYWNFGSQVTSQPSRWKVLRSTSESMTVECT